jgi:hypothetical protein
MIASRQIRQVTSRRERVDPPTPGGVPQSAGASAVGRACTSSRPSPTSAILNNCSCVVNCTSWRSDHRKLGTSPGGTASARRATWGESCLRRSRGIGGTGFGADLLPCPRKLRRGDAQQSSVATKHDLAPVIRDAQGYPKPRRVIMPPVTVADQGRAQNHVFWHRW